MAERLSMEISLNKTKSLTISRNHTKCEVELRGTLIKQVPKFNYLGAEISALRDLKQEVRTQAMKAAHISVCLYNLIWLNKYMSTERKVRIYKTNVRPMLTYASETRAETAYTEQLLRTTDMKTKRAIHGKTLRDKIRSDHLRQLSRIQDMIKWTEDRRREWDAHVGRMEDNRLAKIARDSRPQARQAEEMMETESHQCPYTLTSGRTGVSL